MTEYRHITEAVIANRGLIRQKIDAALDLDPNRKPDEWAKVNRTGAGDLLTTLGLEAADGEGDRWDHLVLLIRKVWLGEPITLPPVSGTLPIDDTARAAAKPDAIPAQPAPAYQFDFTPIPTLAAEAGAVEPPAATEAPAASQDGQKGGEINQPALDPEKERPGNRCWILGFRRSLGTYAPSFWMVIVLKMLLVGL
jgi:hypothetical protein